jgi:hypothetical protein
MRRIRSQTAWGTDSAGAVAALQAGRHRGGSPTSHQLIELIVPPEATFSDCLALVRRRIWGESYFNRSANEQDPVQISPQCLERLLDQLAATA